MLTLMTTPNSSESSPTEAARVLAALSEHRFVGGLERRMVERLAEFARFVRYAPGALIAGAGDAPHSLCLLTEGEVEVLTIAGRDSSSERFGVGDVLGTESTHSQRKPREVRAIGVVKAILLDDTNLEEQMDDDLGFRPALTMCVVRDARMHELRMGPHGHGRHR